MLRRITDPRRWNLKLEGQDGQSRRFHHEINVDGVVRKHDFAICGFVQQSGVQQSVNVAMHGLDIAPGPPRRFAD
jgi:hypothetical protein